MEKHCSGADITGYYSKQRNEMLQFVPSGSERVLDVGCGEGVFGAEIKRRLGAEVWGIEKDSNSSGKAQCVLDKVFCGCVHKLILEMPDNYFDCIIFNDVLEHLDDPYIMLEQVKEKLQDKGMVVCSMPNVRYFLRFKGSFI